MKSIFYLVSIFALIVTSWSAPTLAKTPWSTEITPALLEEVMPEADEFSEKTGTPPAFQAFKIAESGEKTLVGYVFFSQDFPPEEKGYSAPIDMLIGLRTDGQISGIKILNYVESFRYSRGDFLATEGFQEQFQNKSINDPFRLRHDIDEVSGATISGWAITRTVRNAARQVAEQYLNYQPPVDELAEWGKNVALYLETLSWEELIADGFVVQGDIELLTGTTQTLSIVYIGRPALGEFYIGKKDYEAAERNASIRFDTKEMILFTVGGDINQPFQQQKLSVQQGDGPPKRIHPRKLVPGGSATDGAIAGHAEYAGAIVMDENFDPTQPFTVLYQPAGIIEPLTLRYELSGKVLSLVKGERVLSPEEELSLAPWYVHIQHGVLWKYNDVWSVLWLCIVLILATFAFFLKHTALRWIALAATFIYLGFIDGGFLSVSQITGLVAQGPDSIIGNLPLFILVLFTLITTLLWGRLFCSSLCPFGALQDFITRLRPKSWQIKIPAFIHDKAYWIKYGILLLLVVVAFVDNHLSLFQYFEPFGTLFYFSQSLLLWSILLIFVVGCVFVERFYCRYLCPLGAALAIIAVVSPFKIKRVPQCTLCKVCEKACPTGAIEREAINFKECVRCDICEVKLIEKAGSCRHSVEEIAKRSSKPSIVKLISN